VEQNCHTQKKLSNSICNVVTSINCLQKFWIAGYLFGLNYNQNNEKGFHLGPTIVMSILKLTYGFGYIGFIANQYIPNRYVHFKMDISVWTFRLAGGTVDRYIQTNMSILCYPSLLPDPWF
jgi:hypothetical protein